MRDRPNPFRPGAGLDPPYLAGREKELDMFDGVLESGRAGNMKNVLLYGLRGVGKTVLLGRFASVCRNRMFLPVPERVYGPGDSDPAQFASGLKHALRASIERPPNTGAAKGGLRTDGGRLELPAAKMPGQAHEPPHDRGDQGPLKDHLADYLAESWRIIKGLGYAGVVFLLDEFQTVGGAKDKRGTLGDFLAAVNEVQRRECRYSLVLSGLPALARNVRNSRPHAERMFNLTEVTGLAGSDAKRAVLLPLDAVGLKFSPGLANTVVKDAGGYPYFIQFFASEILRRIPKNNINLRDYKSVRGGIMRTLHNDFFDLRMVDLISSEKNTLYQMSMIPETDLKFSAILNATGASRGTVATHLKRLEEKGVVSRHDYGLYKFALPLLRPYLESTLPQAMRGRGRGSGRD